MKTKILLSLLCGLSVLCVSLPSASAVTDNEYIGHFGVTPVGQQAATVATRTALQNFGYVAADGTITATATGTGGTSTATLQKPLGVITTGAITTAAAADHVMTVTNDSVTSASVISVTVNKNGSTGWPVITSVEPGSGSYVIRITNMHATAAFNAALKLMVTVTKY